MPWWLWGIVGIALIALETHTTRNFTLFCVGASAIVVGAMAGLTNTQLWAQWLAFGILSTVTLLWARDWLATTLLARVGGEPEFGNVVGQIAVPIDDLPALGFGKADARHHLERAQRQQACDPARPALSRFRCEGPDAVDLTRVIMLTKSPLSSERRA